MRAVWRKVMEIVRKKPCLPLITFQSFMGTVKTRSIGKNTQIYSYFSKTKKIQRQSVLHCNKLKDKKQEQEIMSQKIFENEMTWQVMMHHLRNE